MDDCIDKGAWDNLGIKDTDGSAGLGAGAMAVDSTVPSSSRQVTLQVLD